ncbi:peptide deformylase, partial [Lactiplantibacillus plantarum]
MVESFDVPPLISHINLIIATPADTQVLTDLLDTLAAHTDNCVGMAA